MIPMSARRTYWLAASLALLAAWSRCSSPEPPLAADESADLSGGPSAGLRLVLALPKPLISVVDSIVAVLDGPLPNPVVKTLAHSAEGPATAIIGAIVPGTGFSLVVRGYDHDGQVIVEGRQDGITVVAGDTVQVTLVLELVAPLPGEGGDQTSGDAGEEEGTDAGDDTGAETGTGESADTGEGADAGDTGG